MTTTPSITGSPLLASQPTGIAPSASSRLDKDTFLKLLVAQLKYQDPSKPVDSSAFIAQSAQFSMVERLQEMATSAQESAAAQRSATATGYLGRSIVAAGSDGNQVSGVVTSVDLRVDGATLHVGDALVPLAAVVGVSLPPAVNAPSASQATTTSASQATTTSATTTPAPPTPAPPTPAPPTTKEV